MKFSIQPIHQDSRGPARWGVYSGEALLTEHNSCRSAALALLSRTLAGEENAEPALIARALSSVASVVRKVAKQVNK